MLTVLGAVAEGLSEVSRKRLLILLPYCCAQMRREEDEEEDMWLAEQQNRVLSNTVSLNDEIHTKQMHILMGISRHIVSPKTLICAPMELLRGHKKHPNLVGLAIGALLFRLTGVPISVADGCLLDLS